ncbi:PD-(D/E)XK motif protein [Sinomonas sp. P47F7]|uniref:PD-(D/E)XK motif protein n=1 Tax=Sinomonas sp. P47F7 TaxID=3410987 RepID=UPI003BF5E892
MSTRESSTSIYSFLASSVPTEGLAARPTDIDTPRGRVVHAINSSGEMMLLVPVDEIGSSSTSWQNDSIAFGYRTFGHPGEVRPYLALNCSAPRLIGEFGLMVDDVLDSIETAPTDAERLTRQVVHRWREMFKDQQQPLMSEDRVLGLLAELLFLEELSDAHGSNVLDHWAGPEGGRHDFVFKKIDVEVKASSSRERFEVAIHGGQQLQHRPDSDLFVRGYRFEQHPGGESLPIVLHRLWDSGMDRLELLKRVARLGYSESDSAQYATIQFSLLESRTCRVDTGFPRLTADTVDPAIFGKLSGLTYSIDLGGEPHEALALSAIDFGS